MPRAFSQYSGSTSLKYKYTAKDENRPRLEDAIGKEEVMRVEDYQAWVLEHYEIDVTAYSFPRFLTELNEWQKKETPETWNLFAEFLDASHDEEFRLFQAYRHSGKSWVCAAYICWTLMQDPCDSIMIMSANQRGAKKNTGFVRQILERFPLCAPLIPRVPQQWSMLDGFMVNRWGLEADASVIFSSLETGFIGFHPNMIICDDIEILHNSQTEKARKGIKEYVSDMMANVASRVIFIGTPWSDDTIYDHVKTLVHFTENQIGQWTCYRDKEKQIPWNVVINGKKHDHAWVERQRRILGAKGFQAQMLLIPANMAETRFDPGFLQYLKGSPEFVRTMGRRRVRNLNVSLQSQYGDNLTMTDCVGYWDPATSDINRAGSAFVVVGSGYHSEPTENLVFVLEARELPPVDPSRTYQNQCREILAIASQYHLSTIYVESNWNDSLPNTLRTVATEQQYPPNIIADGRSNVGGKLNFIAATLDGLIGSKSLYIGPNCTANSGSKLFYQIANFPNAERVDLLDAITASIHKFSWKIAQTKGERDPLALSGFKIKQYNYRTSDRLRREG